MQCATHPKVETELRCGKCDRPICPRCLVYTPVGGRCRSCAQLRPLPLFQVSPLQYAKAAGAAVGIGAVLGAVWGAVPTVPLGNLLSLLLAGGVGYLVGEGVSWAVNRKRGRGLQVIAGLGFIWALRVAGLSPGFPDGPELVASILLIGIVVAASRLRS